MLKDGSEPLNPRLDRIYEEDWKSLNYPITAKLEGDERVPVSKTWSINSWLDQGNEGACVGFGFSHDLLADPHVVKEFQGISVDAAFARQKVYWEAQKIDDWPGGAYPGATPTYEGSSVLAGAKVLTSYGLYSGYHWGLNLQQVALGLSYDGPCILGLKWMRGMQNTDAAGHIYPIGPVDGGHCILAYGIFILFKTDMPRVWENVDLDKSFIKMRNSWGQSWGMRGDCFMSLRNFETLLNDRGEACFPDRVSVVAPTPPPEPAPITPTPPDPTPITPTPPEPKPPTPSSEYKTYRSKPMTVEAIQNTGKNFGALMRFAPGKIAHGRNNSVVVKAGVGGKQGWIEVPTGSWVVSDVGNRNDIWPVDGARFSAVYDATN